MSDEHEPGAVSTDDGSNADDTARAGELEDRLRRALADLDNLRKRFDRELSRQQSAERARVTSAWLPVVDDLERALAHAPDDADPVVTGIRAVLDHALGVIERLGYPRFDDEGRPFDPARHEAVGTVVADAEPGTIVATVRPGYGTELDILRPAGVIVARPPD